MSISKEQLNELEGLLLRGQKYMDRFFPGFEPRTKNEGYFDLYIEAQKHNNFYKPWANKILNILEFEIGDQYYTAKFRRAKPSSKITKFAPDNFYASLEVLDEIVSELRVIYHNQTIRHTNDKLTIFVEYDEPNLLLRVSDNGDRYILHKFRQGDPKAVLEYALKQTDNTARQSMFKPGSTSGIVIKKPIKTVFRQFDVSPFNSEPISRAIIIKTKSICINSNEIVISKNKLNSIATKLKKLK